MTATGSTRTADFQFMTKQDKQPTHRGIAFYTSTRPDKNVRLDVWRADGSSRQTMKGTATSFDGAEEMIKNWCTEVLFCVPRRLKLSGFQWKTIDDHNFPL